MSHFNKVIRCYELSVSLAHVKERKKRVEKKHLVERSKSVQSCRTVVIASLPPSDEDEAELVLRIALTVFWPRLQCPLAVTSGYGDGVPARLLEVGAVTFATAAQLLLHRHRLTFDAQLQSLLQTSRPEFRVSLAGTANLRQLELHAIRWSALIRTVLVMFKEILSNVLIRIIDFALSPTTIRSRNYLSSLSDCFESVRSSCDLAVCSFTRDLLRDGSARLTSVERMPKNLTLSKFDSRSAASVAFAPVVPLLGQIAIDAFTEVFEVGATVADIETGGVAETYGTVFIVQTRTDTSARVVLTLAAVSEAPTALDLIGPYSIGDHDEDQGSQNEDTD